jgi:hypothetical protein
MRMYMPDPALRDPLPDDVERHASAIRAAAATLAALATFLVMLGLCTLLGVSTQPAVLGAILAITFARRPRLRTAGDAALALATVVGVAVVASAEGRLLLVTPILGAALFVGAVTLSVWMRNYAGRVRRLGSAIALPFVAMLFVPPPPEVDPHGRLLLVVLQGAAALLATAFVALGAAIIAHFGVAADDAGTIPPAERARRAGWSPHSRMALQTAVGLASAFAVGFVLFPRHWGWSVLTAFIVGTAARGRGDAAYRALSRLAGAAVGTLAAALLVYVHLPAGLPEAVAIFAVLYAALALRKRHYAYWAAGVTVILGLLAPHGNGSTFALLGVRLAAILAGALCAVAAAWFVMPIRTTDVIRRRLADALAALDDLVQHAHLEPDAARPHRVRFASRLADLEAVAAPMRLHRRVFRVADADHPARWVDVGTAVGEHVGSERFRIPDPAERGAIRKLIGASRRAVGEHRMPAADKTGPSVAVALDALHARVTAPAPYGT